MNEILTLLLLAYVLPLLISIKAIRSLNVIAKRDKDKIPSCVFLVPFLNIGIIGIYICIKLIEFLENSHPVQCLSWKLDKFNDYLQGK